MPDCSQTRSCHESETFNVGDETIRDRTVQPVVNHNDSSHEETMLTEVNMDFRILGLPHSVVKHAQSTSVRELFRKLRTTQIDTLFNKIYEMIQNVGSSNYVNCSRRNPKRSAKHAYHTGISAWSIARAGISCTKKQRPIEISINFRWTFFQSLSMSSRREDLMATDVGERQETNNIIWLTN